ncbi:MAG: hypothetical protein ACI4EO_06595 [Blautia sp.]
MKKNLRTPPGTGISSILLIFILLCMITFSVLSYVSARTDYRLSQKTSEHTRAVYQAENQANDILNQIDARLEKAYASGKDFSHYPDRIKILLKDLDGVSFLDSQKITFQVPVGEEQMLEVCILLSSDLQEGDVYYTIETWKLINSRHWNPDNRLPVYDGSIS